MPDMKTTPTLNFPHTKGGLFYLLSCLLPSLPQVTPSKLSKVKWVAIVRKYPAKMSVSISSFPCGVVTFLAFLIGHQSIGHTGV